MHDARQWREQSSHSSSCIFTTIPCKKIFVPRCQRRYFNQTFYRSHYPNGMIACGLCFICQPSCVKNCSRGFLVDGFLKNPYTFTYFCHHTAIHSFSNWFICFDFGYFFYNKDFFAFCKDFFAFCKVFSTFHIARRIIKLIAWTTSFLEERLDFDITWLIWNANNPTMSPRWPKNINLCLKRLLLIQNAWRMNLT